MLFPRNTKNKIQFYAIAQPLYEIYRLLREEKFSRCVYTELIEKGKVFPQKAYERQQLTQNATFLKKTP